MSFVQTFLRILLEERRKRGEREARVEPEGKSAKKLTKKFILCTFILTFLLVFMNFYFNSCFLLVFSCSTPHARLALALVSVRLKYTKMTPVLPAG